MFPFALFLFCLEHECHCPRRGHSVRTMDRRNLLALLGSCKLEGETAKAKLSSDPYWFSFLGKFSLTLCKMAGLLLLDWLRSLK